MRSTDMATMNAPASTLNTETSIALSQSMDSVNATPEEESHTLTVSKQASQPPSWAPVSAISATTTTTITTIDFETRTKTTTERQVLVPRVKSSVGPSRTKPFACLPSPLSYYYILQSQGLRGEKSLKSVDWL